MTERNIDTGIWADAWFQDLDPPRKLLFIYLWTNPHCSSAGMYQISARTIAFDTGLSLEEIPSLLESLAPKVRWYQSESLLWVPNFLRRQSRSPKFLTAVAKSLRHLPGDRVSEFLSYNSNVSIPYQYPINTVAIPSAQDQPKDQTSLKPKALSLKPEDQPETPPTPKPEPAAAATEKQGKKKDTIIQVYEQELGQLITPLIADELLAWAKDVPEQWVSDALHEASAHGKRTWAYARRILTRWKQEGRNNGTKPSPTGQAAMDDKEAIKARYLGGRYGKLIES